MTAVGQIETTSRSRVIPVAQLVDKVRSGDNVALGWGPCEPTTFMRELLSRRGTLHDVMLADTLGGFNQANPFLDPAETSFRSWTTHIGDTIRPAIGDGRAEFMPPAYGTMYRHEESGRTDRRKADMYVVKVSAPDNNGLCSFGSFLWLHKYMAERAHVVVGEITPGLIRTFGDNFIHESVFDWFIESEDQQGGSLMRPAPAPEREPIIAAIGAQVNQIVRDGDTLEFGAGKISSAMPPFLYDKHDLGVHTEACPASVIPMVRAGVVNGKRKEIHTGKLCASAIGAWPDDQPFIDRNPAFELYDIRYIDDPRVIASHSNFVAVNQAMAIDLTGQVNSEGLEPLPYSGPGGQPDFVIGAMMSRGGRSITVLQSTAKQGTISTIMPVLPEGAAVTVSRNYVDFVVTEYGAVSLQGKTLQQRARELISVAHPDFRGELEAAYKQRRIFV